MSPRAAALWLGLVAGTGCGRTEGGSDAGPDAGADGGVVPADATALTATRRGGFGLVPCPQDGGAALADRFHLGLDGGGLDAVVCKRSRMELVVAARTLSAQELAGVRTALAGLAASTDGCGADKPELRVSLDTPSGTLQLVDDFYACQRQVGVEYVEGMDQLFTTLDALVP